MKSGLPRKVMPGEARVAMTPDSACMVQKLGHECILESDAGLGPRFRDDDDRAAGVTAIARGIAMIDILGGFMVTRRMCTGHSVS